MSDDRRDQVRDAALYLREVRPIDPGEISEYVAEQPHPGVVRRDLRAMAVDLDLREREDGTFVPVESGPLRVSFDGVDALPDRHCRRLAELLRAAYGPDWPAGETGEALRETIRQLKADYLHQRPIEYDRDTALGYAVYHLPASYAAVQYVVADLVAAELVPRTLRVLEVGAGVGGPALGLHDLVFGPDPAEAAVEYDAVEPSAAADVFESMVDGTHRNFHATVHRETAEAFDPPGDYDLVLFANVLSELADPVAVVERYLDRLAPAGSLVAVAPADRNTATGLRTVERAVADGDRATVYAPTVRLWPGYAPSDRGWTFDRRPDLAGPPFQRQLDEAAADADHEPDEFVNVDVQFAYTVLRTDGRRAIEFTPDPSRAARMAEMDSHVTERIDCYAVTLSPDIGDDNPLFKVGDGSERVDHYAVLVEETSLNADLRRADYGDLLHLENALVLWNDDEEAYNLVVDEESTVRRIPT